MRMFQLRQLKLLFVGAIAPASAYYTLQVDRRSKQCASPPAQNASGLPEASSQKPPEAIASAVASALSEESRGLEESLSLLRPMFESLRNASGEDGGVPPEDPLFGTPDAAGVAPHDVEMTLIRYLRVARASLPRREQGDARRVADEALERIRATLRYRSEYDALAMHAPDMARRLMFHDTNPGACMYLADAGAVDARGQPVLFGRLDLMMAEDAEQHEPIVPANHLRAAMFVFERMATSLRLAKGQRRGIYILDCGMDRRSAPDLYDSVDPRPRHWSRNGALAVNGLTMGGWRDKNKTPRVIPGVLPHLEHHSTIDPGLSVLREALRQLTQYYPDVMERVYFVRPPLSFRAFMKVFSLMVDKETAEKFVVIPSGSESRLLESVNADQLPIEFGGSGPSLGRDDFLRTALLRYEEESLSGEATKKAVAGSRARANDMTAGISTTQGEAISNGGKLVSSTRTKLFSSDDHDEVPLGEFVAETQLVISQHYDGNGRQKLMWPINGFVEIEG